MQNEFGIWSGCNDPVLFDSRQETFKSPFGAVSTRRKLRFAFPVRSDLNATGVTLVMRRNEMHREYHMSKQCVVGNYDVFLTEFAFSQEGTYFYRFEIQRNEGVLYCGKGEGGKAVVGEWLPEWQLSVYQSHYKTADFIKGGVVYQIFADRFFRVGKPVKPRYGVLKSWDEDVTIVDPDGQYRANDFYGGNFDGITAKLDYLQSLGVTAIYLSPIFESNSNHRYDTADYTKIDPVLGGEAAFERFLQATKEKGIAVILDGVFNHTGADSVYFNKFGHYDSLGAYQSKDSPYYDWFTFYEFPDNYHCWWGCTVVPTVARDADGYHELIAGEDGVLAKWIGKGVKGWRLDVVDELSEYFVKKIRERIKKSDPDALVLGEVWEDASTKYSYGEEREYFFGYDLDGVMNYVYKDAICAYIGGGSAKEFVDRVTTILENYPKDSLDTCFTMIDSHDTVRAINVFAGKSGCGMNKEEKKRYRLTPDEYECGKRRLKIASALQYFLPGVPCVYYGDEAGLQGFEDPLNRRPYPWGNEDRDLIEHYRALGALRAQHRDAFRSATEIREEDGKVYVRRSEAELCVDMAQETFTVKIGK